MTMLVAAELSDEVLRWLYLLSARPLNLIGVSLVTLVVALAIAIWRLARDPQGRPGGTIAVPDGRSRRAPDRLVAGRAVPSA